MKRVLALFCLLALLPLKAEARTEPVTQEQIDACIASEGLEYYAYMILADAPEELEPVILEARKRIINNSAGWVDDELSGWVLDPNGNIVEVVPKFHEIFPEDWEIPILD